METKLRKIPTEKGTGVWKVIFLEGKCPACNMKSKFQYADFRIFKSAFLKIKSVSLTPKKAIDNILSEAGDFVECVNCKHIMAYCKNCRLGFSANQYATIVTCPSCKKDYAGYG